MTRPRVERFCRICVGMAAFTSTLLTLGACQNQYSPNTYSTTGVQQASKVDRAVVESFRVVDVRESGLGSGVGALGGAAAGGIAGSQIGNGGGNAIATLGGVLIGGAIGILAEKSITDTQAYEYIVRKANGDLLSVTQQDPQPLGVGQRVLIIYGVNARIIPDAGAASPQGPAPTVGQTVAPVAPAAPAGQPVQPIQSLGQPDQA